MTCLATKWCPSISLQQPKQPVVSLLNPLSAVASSPGGMMHNIAVLEQYNNSCISSVFQSFFIGSVIFFFFVFIKVILLYYWLYDMTSRYFKSTLCSFLLKISNRSVLLHFLKIDGLKIFSRKKGQFAFFHMVTLSTGTILRIKIEKT